MKLPSFEQLQAPQPKFFWLIVVPALLIQFVGSLFYLVFFPSWSELVYPTTKILMILWPTIWIASGIAPMARAKRGERTLRFGLISGAAMFGVLMCAYVLLRGVLDPYIPMLQATVDEVGLRSYYIPFAIFLSVLHSGFEEFYWRWFVFGMLRHRYAFGVASVISSVTFAAHHYVVLSNFLPLPLVIFAGSVVGLVGWFWCYVYEKTNSIGASWLSHAIADAAIMLIGYWLIF